MTRVILDMSPSLDGFVAGREIRVDAPFGTAGHRLHRWLGMDGGEPDSTDRAAATLMLANAGAVVIGRRMFEVGIGEWGDDGAWERPCFVVTRRPGAPLVRGPTTFIFVTDGVTAAVARARETAAGRDVVIAGGGELARQCLALGLVDELRLHVVPVLLGEGARLFGEDLPARELRLVREEASANALHQIYEVMRP